MMKNAFYLTLKALFVLNIFDFSVIWKNGLIRKITLIPKVITSQTGYQTIVMHILPISFFFLSGFSFTDTDDSQDS